MYRSDPVAWLESLDCKISPSYVTMLCWVLDQVLPQGVRHILDVGYGWGVSTMLWLEAFPGALVTTVDPLPPGGYGSCTPTAGLSEADAARWTFIQGMMEDVAGELAPAYDFIFLDADHAYASTVEQLAACWDLLEPGGILAGHDWISFPDDVGKAVAEFATYWGLTVDYCSLDAGAWLIRKPVCDAT